MTCEISFTAGLPQGVQDSAQQIVPRRAGWRILHLAGGYYLWIQFMVSFAKRVPTMPLCAVFLIPLWPVMALRLTAMASARTPRTARAG